MNSASWLGREWQHLSRCTSTNDVAMALGRAGAPHGTVVTAEAQERGRGRLGRAWYSPPGENLYLSVLLRPPLSPQQAPFLTLCAGVALADAVEDTLHHDPASFALPPLVELKWPNDLMLGGGDAPAKKAGGILTEMVCVGSAIDFVVIGIGCNVNCTAFPPELSATSLRLALASDAATAMLAPLSIGDFSARLLGHLARWYERFLAAGTTSVLAGWRRHAGFLHRSEPISVRTSNRVLMGTPLGLDSDGALLLRDRGGTVHRVLAGEITLG